MGELRVDPVLPLDPYFSSNSANSFLLRENKIEAIFGKKIGHGQDGHMFLSSFTDLCLKASEVELNLMLSPIKSVDLLI